MKNINKIDEIVEFVVSHPDTIASKTIMRRNFVSSYYFETGAELGIQLRAVLKQLDEDDINKYFVLVK